MNKLLCNKIHKIIKHYQTIKIIQNQKNCYKKKKYLIFNNL